ncbi:hypothetical protein Tco_0074106 [Tanacetum coccineum]
MPAYFGGRLHRPLDSVRSLWHLHLELEIDYVGMKDFDNVVDFRAEAQLFIGTVRSDDGMDQAEVEEEVVVIEMTQKHQRLLKFPRDLLVVEEEGAGLCYSPSRPLTSPEPRTASYDLHELVAVVVVGKGRCTVGENRSSLVQHTRDDDIVRPEGSLVLKYVLERCIVSRALFLGVED